MPNAADRKSIRTAEKGVARAEREAGEVLIGLMSGTPGRAWVWAKLEAAHIFRSSFATDPIRMAFNEGERNAGLQLLNDLIRWCPDLFIQAMREANGRRTDIISSSASASGGGNAESFGTEPTTGSEYSGGEDGGWGDQDPGSVAVDPDGQVRYSA